MGKWKIPAVFYKCFLFIFFFPVSSILIKRFRASSCQYCATQEIKLIMRPCLIALPLKRKTDWIIITIVNFPESHRVNGNLFIRRRRDKVFTWCGKITDDAKNFFCIWLVNSIAIKKTNDNFVPYSITDWTIIHDQGLDIFHRCW